jgi:mono/diheme cytochrome c family protein
VGIAQVLCDCILLGFALAGSVGRCWADNVDNGKSGQEIFQKDCSGCHAVSTPDARNHDSVLHARGPSLANSGEKFVPERLEKWLQRPIQIWSAGYLSSRHVVATTQGDQIDERWKATHIALPAAQAHQVAVYLLSLKKEPNQFPISTAATEIPAKLLFEKVLGCGSCHQAEPGRGGESGPELYTAAQRLKKDWVRAFIADPQYWGSGLMAKSNIGASQLEAVVNYLYEPKQNDSPAEHLLAPPGNTDELPAEESQHVPGKMLYLTFCSQCHGVQGNGKGLNARSMSVAPRNHSSSEEMAGLTDERLFAAIKFGGAAVGKSSLMPSWATLLTDADIDSLVGYLHKLNGSSASSEVPVNPTFSTPEGRSSK